MKFIALLAFILFNMVLNQSTGYNLQYELQKQIDLVAQKDDKAVQELEKVKKYIAENQNSDIKKPLSKEEMSPEQLNTYNNNIELLLQEVIKQKFEMQKKAL